MATTERIPDGGVIKGGKIEYTALPYPLPKNVREILKEIGNDCLSGEGSHTTLLNFECRLRNLYGIKVIRDVIIPR